MSNPAYSRVAAYHWYLGSAFWRERREFILGRANHICEKCEKRRATEVHHLTYIRVFQTERPNRAVQALPLRNSLAATGERQPIAAVLRFSVGRRGLTAHFSSRAVGGRL